MGKSHLIWVVVAILAAGALAPPPSSTVSEVAAALDRGDAQQAMSLSNAALKQEIGDPHTRARLLLYHGLAMELLGAHDTAMRDITEALDSQALAPDEQGEAYLQRAILREGLGQADEAIRDYDAVAALRGLSAATALNKRGNLNLRRGRPADAQQDYLAALAADSGQAQYSFYGLGQVAETSGETLTARGFYAKALAVDAGYVAASARLRVLGGPPPAADQERIILLPPMPPQSEGDQGAIFLHLPTGKRDVGKVPAVSPQRRTGPATALLLRPALDQSDAPGPAREVSQIQLGAWRSSAEAYAAWDHDKARAGGLLDGLDPEVLAVDIPERGRYFRLRVQMGEKAGSAQICPRLQAKGLDCFAVRN